MKPRCLVFTYHMLILVQLDAFSIQSATKIRQISSSLTHATRRDILESWILSTTSAIAAISVSDLPKAAFADVDFNTIQDLLGSPANQQPQEYLPGGKRPMYLTEPTQEFKLNEEKSMEFKRKNLKLKKDFVAALDKLSTDPNNSATLATDLDEIRRLVKINGGLPEGITKDEVVKICRRRKSKKFWPTEVEIA